MTTQVNESKGFPKHLALAVAALAVLTALGWWLRERSTEHQAASTPAGGSISSSQTGQHGRTRLQGEVSIEPRSHAPARLQLSVVDAAQQPIRGASVRWSALDAEWIAAEGEWPRLDWEKLDRQTVSATTDEHGEASVELPNQSGARGVLWVTDPRYAAAAFVSDERGEPALPRVIVLRDPSHLNVRVAGAAGVGAEALEVESLADCRELSSSSLDALQCSARRTYRRTWTAKASELVAIEPLAVEQAVQASCGNLRSEPWFGRAPADITLELRPTFVLGGRVRTEGPTGPVEAWVTCRAVRGFEKSQLARVHVATDGAFGDMRLPVLECDSYEVELIGPQCARQFAQIVDPAAGDRRTVEFSISSGVTVAVQAVDPESLGIAGATVTAQWLDDTAWRRVERRTNADGIASFEGLPPASVWLRVRAAGFVPKLAEPVETSTHDGKPIRLQLTPAGRVEGRCLIAGQPARDFTVHFWSKQPTDGGKLEVRGSADGHFVVDEAAPGEFVLMATGTTSLQSPQVRVLVDYVKTAEAVLELPAPLTLTGRVVNGMTGEALSSGRAALQVTVRDQILRPWKEATRVDARGVFSIEGAVPGLNTLRVTADGFAPRAVVVHAEAGRPLDVGLIGLHQHGSLELQLERASPEELQSLRVDLQGVDLRPAIQPSNAGVVRFDRLMPGTYFPRIIFADNSTRYLLTHVAPGRHVRLVTPISIAGFEIEVVGATPEIAEKLYELHVAFAGDDEVAGDEYYPVRRGKAVQVRSLPAKRVVLEASDSNRVVLGVGRFELSGKPGEVLRFVVDGHSPELRIVDRDRQPIAGASVGIIGANLDPTWTRYYITDGDGRCSLDGITFESLGVRLQHADHGVTAVRIVELPRDPTRPLELVLDARLALRVQVMDHTTPLGGIELYARDEARFENGLANATSDPTGLATWRAVSAGAYEVAVVHPGLWPDRARIVVTEANPPVEMQVRRLGGAEFRVTTALGQPVRGVRVDLHSLERDVSVAKWIETGAVPAPGGGLITDEQGRLTVRGLPNGDFSYRATLPNGSVIDGSVRVPPLDVIEVPVRVE